jgi:2,4-diketo-3-deoxy-L-fuconate hydrolase
MEFLRLGDPGSELPVVRHSDTYYRLDSLTADIDGAFLVSDGLTRAAAAVNAGELDVFDAPERADSLLQAPEHRRRPL